MKRSDFRVVVLLGIFIAIALIVGCNRQEAETGQTNGTPDKPVETVKTVGTTKRETMGSNVDSSKELSVSKPQVIHYGTTPLDPIPYPHEVIQNEESEQVGAGEIQFTFDTELPENYKYSTDSMQSLVLHSTNGEKISFENEDGEFQDTISIEFEKFPVTIKAKSEVGQSMVAADFKVAYCGTEKFAVCRFDRVRVKTPIEITEDGQMEKTISYKVEIDEPTVEGEYEGERFDVRH